PAKAAHHRDTDVDRGAKRPDHLRRALRRRRRDLAWPGDAHPHHRAPHRGFAIARATAWTRPGPQGPFLPQRTRRWLPHGDGGLVRERRLPRARARRRLAVSTLHDLRGPIGYGLQSLLLGQRKSG